MLTNEIVDPLVLVDFGSSERSCFQIDRLGNQLFELDLKSPDLLDGMEELHEILIILSLVPQNFVFSLLEVFIVYEKVVEGERLGC